MITEIGIAAGDIWHYLDEHKRSSLSDIEKEINKPRDMLLMSLGWLARENHVKVEQVDGEYYIELAKAQEAQ